MHQSEKSEKSEKFILTVLLLLGALFRLPALLTIPLFFDESAYLDRAINFPAKLPLTLVEGKLVQELLLAILVRLPGDLLLNGRLLSLCCGLATMIVLWRIGRQLGHGRAGLIAAGLYAITVPAFLHDGLAIPDSLLTLVATVFLWASLRFVLNPQPTQASALGLSALLVLASLVKLPGLFLAAWPLCLLVFARNTQIPWREYIKLLRRSLIAVLLVLAMLAPFHYGGNEQGKLMGDWLATRIRNLGVLADWLLRYLPIWLPIPAVVALLAGLCDSMNARILKGLLACGSAFIIIFLVIGAGLAPRYILPAWPPLLLACALGIEYCWQAARVRAQKSGAAWYRSTAILRGLTGAVLATTLFWNTAVLLSFIQTPQDSLLAAIDRRQYFETWTAGYGRAEIVALLDLLAKEHGPLTIVAHDQSRLIHNIPTIYLHNRADVRFVYVDLKLDHALDQLGTTGKPDTVLLLDEQEMQAFSITERFPQLKQIALFQNPYSSMRFYIFEVHETTHH